MSQDVPEHNIKRNESPGVNSVAGVIVRGKGGGDLPGLNVTGPLTSAVSVILVTDKISCLSARCVPVDCPRHLDYPIWWESGHQDVVNVSGTESPVCVGVNGRPFWLASTA